MKNKRLQCKDLSDKTILQFLNGPFVGWAAPGWGTWFRYDNTVPPNSVYKVLPADTPERLVLAKMRNMIDRGVINGCTCGCRGDFEITAKGKDLLTKLQSGQP